VPKEEIDEPRTPRSCNIALHNASRKRGENSGPPAALRIAASRGDVPRRWSRSVIGDCKSMKARIKWSGDVSFVAESGSGHAIVVDGAPEAGGRNIGMRPMELVLAGAAACTAFDVVWILRKARQPVTDCVVEAEAERAPAEPKVFTRIHLRYRITGRGLDPHQVERAVKLSKEKYCSATIMLASTAEITTELVVTDAQDSLAGARGEASLR